MQVTGNELKGACSTFADLTKSVGDLKSKGKLTAGQAAEISAAVAAIAADIGC